MNAGREDTALRGVDSEAYPRSRNKCATRLSLLLATSTRTVGRRFGGSNKRTQGCLVGLEVSNDARFRLIAWCTYWATRSVARTECALLERRRFRKMPGGVETVSSDIPMLRWDETIMRYVASACLCSVFPQSCRHPCALGTMCQPVCTQRSRRQVDEQTSMF